MLSTDMVEARRLVDFDRLPRRSLNEPLDSEEHQEINQELNFPDPYFLDPPPRRKYHFRKKIVQ